jgi:hypothetical protein
MTKQYHTLEGLKRAAVKRRKAKGCNHHAALELEAREAGFNDYHDARRAFERGEPDSAMCGLTTGRIFRQGNLEILEMAPELAAALKHQRGLDIADAGPHAPEPEINHRGVVVSSRYGSSRELMTMSSILDALPDGARDRIESIWCDSGAGACYTVAIRPDQWLDFLPDFIRETTMSVAGGFNSLTVEDHSHRVYFDPDWDEDEYISD